MLRAGKASLLLLLFGLILSACASTAPTAVGEPTALSPSAAGTSTNPPVSGTAVATDAGAEHTGAEDEGIVTASMTALGLSGERYATMGDPSAPITLVEFSDYG